MKTMNYSIALFKFYFFLHFLLSVAGNVAGVMDGERSGSDEVHNAECCVEAERRERLDEIRDSSPTAQTHPRHQRELS